MPKAYIRGFQKTPFDTRKYTSAVQTLFQEASAEIGGAGWNHTNVTFIDSGSIITMFIIY